MLPKSALRVEEEAWNAYPYTKTIFRCPFIEKFSITIETVYHQDSGTQENVFGLSSRDLEGRDVGMCFNLLLNRSLSQGYVSDSLFYASTLPHSPMSLLYFCKFCVIVITGSLLNVWS